jgi:hypothetical protein
MKKTLLAALLATLPLPAFAQAQPAAPARAPAAAAPAASPAPAAPLPDADPALWVVRDNDTTVYLFGTFHMLDGRRDWFNEEVREAFDASQEMVVEVIMPENPAELQRAMGPLVQRYAIDPQGRTLSSQLTPEQNATLNAKLTSFGVPNGAFDRFEPWFVATTLAAMAGQKMGMTGEQGAETVLKRAARQRNMSIGQVETIEQQLAMFDSVPAADQINMLRETLDDMDQMNAMLPRMLDAWNSGNAETLDAVMNESMNKYPSVRRIMLGDRNARWAEWIQQRMARPGTVFMAVGAGHLVGNDSVQTFLAQRNLRAERVAAR